MDQNPRIAILWHGNCESRNHATATTYSKFSNIFQEFHHYNITAVPVVYNDEFVEEVRLQLTRVDGVLVWVNPIEGGRDRSILDDMLRKVASTGVFVSTHPDVILKLGTKEVLFQTREMDWGGDIHLYKNIQELRQQLPARLANGTSRVLKQNRGNNGNGVWRVEFVDGNAGQGADPVVRVLQALSNSSEKEMPLSEFISQCESYFAGSGKMIDQPFYSPVPDGMIRCLFCCWTSFSFTSIKISKSFASLKDGFIIKADCTSTRAPAKSLLLSLYFVLAIYFKISSVAFCSL